MSCKSINSPKVGLGKSGHLYVIYIGTNFIWLNNKFTKNEENYLINRTKELSRTINKPDVVDQVAYAKKILGNWGLT